MARYEPQYISATEFAQVRNSTKQYICKLIKEKKINAKKDGKFWKIPISELRRIDKLDL